LYKPHEPLKVPKLVPRALGDLVELLGDDVVEVRQSVGSEEVIDDGELGRAGALLLGFILGRRLRIDVARVSGGPWGVPGLLRDPFLPRGGAVPAPVARLAALVARTLGQVTPVHGTLRRGL
jgi:hypothetical protein